MAIKPVKIEHEIDNSDFDLGYGWLKNQEQSKTTTKFKDKNGIYISKENESLIDTVSKRIKDAKEIICLSSFLIQKTKVLQAIENAAKRGVRVYMILAAGNILEQYNDPDEVRRKEFEETLRELSKNHLVRDGQFHSKFIVIDPHTDPSGFLFTCNLTKRALTKNIEVALELNSEQAKELFKQFCHGFWYCSEREIINESGKKSHTLRRLDKKEKPEELPDVKHVKWTLDDSNLLKNTLIEMISSAEESISVSSWKFDIEHDVSQKIIEKSKSGVDITIFTRPHMSNSEFLKELKKSGAKIYGQGLMHAKTIVVDKKKGLLMTANFEERGLDIGFETGLELENQQIDTVLELHEIWKKKCGLIHKKGIKMKEATRKNSIVDENGESFILLNDGNKLPKLTEKSKYKGSLKKVKIPKSSKAKKKEINCKSMGEYVKWRKNQEKLIKKHTVQEKLAIKEKLILNLVPPFLPDDAEKIENEEIENFDIYRVNDKRYLVLNNIDDYKLAKKIENFDAKIVAISQ